MNLGQVTETFGAEDLSWLGSAHGVEMADSCTLDRTTLTTEMTDAGVVPAGVIVGRITASGLFGPYDDAETDGREVAVGLLVADVQTKAAGNPVGAYMVHGQVIIAKLPTQSGYDAAAAADLPLIDFV